MVFAVVVNFMLKIVDNYSLPRAACTEINCLQSRRISLNKEKRLLRRFHGEILIMFLNVGQMISGVFTTMNQFYFQFKA